MKMLSSFKYQICNRCIMDTSAEDIFFDINGNCNFCCDFINAQSKSQKKKYELKELISIIKKDGHKKKYDCIVGLSGGVDSTFSLIKACENGLRPLAVHLDNGWNSELAQYNMSNLIRTYNVDLITHVINWQEYRDYQQAFFDSNVIDIELLMDNAMLAINYKYASKFGIRYILSGTNTSTEGFKIPKNWSWFKNDKKNILYIGKKFRNLKPITFPMFGTFDFIYYELIKKIKWILFPDYFNYSKNLALSEIISKIGYKPYPYKHYESIFTRFYQAYILPKKFGVDKRKLHLSNLILSGELTRKEALIKIQQMTYPSEEEEERDIKYFLKKMNWSKSNLESYCSKPEIKHSFYKSEIRTWDFLKKMYKKLKSK
jgi:N-acetyl sugar amidotransferase